MIRYLCLFFLCLSLFAEDDGNALIEKMLRLGEEQRASMLEREEENKASATDSRRAAESAARIKYIKSLKGHYLPSFLPNADGLGVYRGAPIKIIQVVNKSEAIVEFPSGAWCWISNVVVADMTDDQRVYLRGAWQSIGTKSYTTVLGGSKTVRHIRMVLSEEDANKLSQEKDEAGLQSNILEIQSRDLEAKDRLEEYYEETKRTRHFSESYENRLKANLEHLNLELTLAKASFRLCLKEKTKVREKRQPMQEVAAPKPEKTPEQAQAEWDAKIKAAPIYVMNDGTQIRAQRDTPIKDEVIIQDFQGNWLTIKKSDIKEIVKPK